jgi:hypothetical protein
MRRRAERSARSGAKVGFCSFNYFIYPHVEVGGATYDGPIENSFAYRDVPDRTARFR